MRRPTCPAAAEHRTGRVTCIRPRWHRGRHRSDPGQVVEIHWVRDWRAALQRWRTIPHVEPIDWGKR
jgi:hypothetical protein